MWEGVSSGGQTDLTVDGELLGSVGDDLSKDNTYDVVMQPGKHTIHWKLMGGHFGDANKVEVLNKANNQPIAVTGEAPADKNFQALPTQREVKLSELQANPQNRIAAQWVRKNGHGVKIDFKGMSKMIYPTDKLPDEPFMVSEIFMNDSKTIEDADLANLVGLENLYTLSLVNCKGITGKGFVSLANISTLRTLYLSGSNVDDAGLVHLASLSNLAEINFVGTKVTGTGLLKIPSLPVLWRLTFGDQTIDNDALAHNKTLAPRLSVIEFTRCNLTDVGLQHVSALGSSLNGLDISGSQVTANGLVHLKKLTNVHLLLLSSLKIDDAALANISDLTRMDNLNLSDTLITDAGLAHLSKMKDLTTLNTTNTKVTPQALTGLKSTLPKLK